MNELTELAEVYARALRCEKCGRFLAIVRTESDMEEQTTRIFLRCVNPRHGALQYYADVKWK